MAGRFVQRPRSCTTPARSSFAVAEEAGIDSIATYLWAIRNGHSNARPAVISAALIRAAADHGGAAVNLRRIAICEEHGSHGQRPQRRRTEGPSTQGRGWILGSSQQLTLEEFDRVLDSRGRDHVAGVRHHREFAVGQRTVGACGLLD